MPRLQKLYEKYRDQPIAMYAVNTFQLRDAGTDPIEFAKQRGVTYPVLLKGDDVAAAYRVTGIPTFYLIDAEGRVLLARSGGLRPGDTTLESAIDQALARTSSQPASAPAGPMAAAQAR
jgi:thiol-disulfide isomerase/thioredoxin